MKNLIFGISLLMSITGTTICCASTTKDTPKNQMTGAYTEQRDLTKQEKVLFKRTYKGKEKLKPVSVSTQVVNGTNYKFICKNKMGEIVTVIIHQSLPHEGSNSKVLTIIN